MRRSRWARRGTTAVSLAFLTVLLGGCSTKSWESSIRWGWPTGVTKQATEMRVLWTWTGVTALALGVVVWGLIFWCCIRYRAKGADAEYIPRQTKYNIWVEGICFSFPFVILAVLFWRTVLVEDDVNHVSADPQVQVQVDAFKWNWQFEYHSYRLGQGTSPITAAYASSDGSVLRDPQDQKKPYYLSTVGSQNEIPILVIPRGETVLFDEHSLDVIHSFWVPEFLFKRDVIPYDTNSTAHDNHFQITATKTGSFVGRCAELCGTYHSQMNFEVRVVPPATFARYLSALKSIGPADPARQAKALRIAMPGQSPYATTTYPFDTSRTGHGPSTPQNNGS